MDSSHPSEQQAETRLVTSGRDTKAQKGFVNPPVFHGSTVLYPTAEDLHAHRGEFQYGRRGTPTTKALQEALMALEGPQCAGVGIAPSGLGWITTGSALKRSWIQRRTKEDERLVEQRQRVFLLW